MTTVERKKKKKNTTNYHNKCSMLDHWRANAITVQSARGHLLGRDTSAINDAH